MPTLPSSETSALTLGARRAAILAALSALTLTAATLRAAPWSADQSGAPQAPAPPPPAAQTTKPGELGYEDTPTIPGQTWRVHDVNRPAPPLVVPGATPGAAPSDAIVLFDGKNLDQWVSTRDKSPAGWTVADGVVTVNKPAGNIETKRSFTNFQLHLEWRVPEGVTGTGQARGNSGLFLAGTGEGDAGYELQILDSYNNETYVNGQAGSVYKQYIPLVNAMRKPGEWQTYDVIWTAPVFNADGSLRTPAFLTAFHNGVLIQNHVELKGETRNIGKPEYKKHGAAPIKLQAHGDPSPPISFQNIWVREL
jgi:3-keto-disaccharide hydrolase